MPAIGSISSFNYFRRGETVDTLAKVVSPWGFDYFRGGEPTSSIIVAGRIDLILTTVQGQNTSIPRATTKTLIA